MSYAVTSTGEVFEDSLLGAPGWRLPGWRYATLYYSARTKKRHTYGGFAGTPVWDEANYKKMDSTRIADVSDLEEAIRRADAAFARSGTPTKAALDVAAKKFVEQQFVPKVITPLTPVTTPSALPVAAPAPAPTAPEWVLPATIGVGALLFVTALVLVRGRSKGA